VVKSAEKTSYTEEFETYDFDPEREQVLIVPFDPHLYFSDADQEIANASHIPQVKVRDIFRRRLNALLDPQGYETIHLLGGRFRDTISDLNRVYRSVTYNYQDVLMSDRYKLQLEAETQKQAEGSAQEGETKVGSWLKKQSDKMTTNTPQTSAKSSRNQFPEKFFGVKVKDPSFFDYFNKKYSIDYYVFINQFEVVTDYEHCLDRAAGNYARYFVAHFTIFDKSGKMIAGNRYTKIYNSINSDVYQNLGENMGEMAQKVLLELPLPGEEVH
jgi:hypothetical protein